MSLSDFQTLKKLVTLATSENDNEALSAWRKATKLVTSSGFTWEMLLDKRVNVINEIEPAEDPDEMTDLFDKALRGATGTFRDTILSIQAQYESRGFLTPRQREVVEGAAERTVDRHPGGRFR